MNGENFQGKTPLGEFKVITPENSSLSLQAVTIEPLQKKS